MHVLVTYLKLTCAWFQRGADREVDRIQDGTRWRESVLHERGQAECRREMLFGFEGPSGLLLLSATALLLLLLDLDGGGFVIDLRNVAVRYQCGEGPFASFGGRWGTRS